MSKAMKVLKHLKDKKRITSWEAIKLYRATRLSAIIFNLREKYNIQTIMQEAISEDGIPYRYAEYIYLGENKKI